MNSDGPPPPPAKKKLLINSKSSVGGGGVYIGGTGGCGGGGGWGPCIYGGVSGVGGNVSADDGDEYSTVNSRTPSGHRSVTQRSEFGQFWCN